MAVNLLAQKMDNDCVDLKRVKAGRQKLTNAERQEHWKNVLNQTVMVMRETCIMINVI